MKRFTTLAVLLACTIPAAQAAGTMSASVSFTNLAFSVTDLTPADGVDPFFELLPSTAIKTTTSVYRDTPAFFENQNAVDAFANATVTKTFGDWASALAKVTGTSIEALASGPVTSAYAIESSANLEGSVYSALIRIAPGTRLSFSGNAELQTDANCGAACYAQALLELHFGYFGEEASVTKTLFSDLSSPSRSYTGPLGLSYANTSSEDQFLGLVIHADAQVASMVPEPGTWALALGGGLLALRLHRRPKSSRGEPRT